MTDESYKTGYWKAYAQAIRDADVELQKVGDDRTVRQCRKLLLALVGVEYHPEWVADNPVWPSELQGVKLTLL